MTVAYTHSNDAQIIYCSAILNIAHAAMWLLHILSMLKWYVLHPSARLSPSAKWHNQLKVILGTEEMRWRKEVQQKTLFIHSDTATPQSICCFFGVLRALMLLFGHANNPHLKDLGGWTHWSLSRSWIKCVLLCSLWNCICFLAWSLSLAYLHVQSQLICV